LQNIEGKKIWNVNCVLSGMGIVKAHIEDASESVLKMEKSSILDYIKKVPAEKLKEIGQSKPEKQGSIQKPREKLKNLEKLEEAIEEEKKKIKMEMEKEKKKKD